MNIPKTKERQEALALWQAAEDAVKAYQDAEDKALTPEIAEKYDSLERQADENCATEDEYDLAVEKITEERDVVLGIVEHAAKMHAAEDARDDYPEHIRYPWIEAAQATPMRCKASGAILLHSDEVVEDIRTGEAWLRCAIGLPPRPPEPEEEEDVEEAA